MAGFGCPPRGQTIGLAAALQRAYNGIKQNLTEAADKLSDADYGYRPSPEIRPYGGQFGHLANFHYLFCSTVKGEANPNQGQDLEKKTTKGKMEIHCNACGAVVYRGKPIEWPG